MKVAMIVVAAGKGVRFGQSLPKAFVPLLGSTLLERSIRTLAGVPGVELIVPVVAEAELGRFAALPLGDVGALAAAVAGGAERQASVANGLAAVPGDFDLIGVHDAARCLVGAEEIRRVIGRAAETGAALLARPVRDTIKVVQAGRVIESTDRATLWAAQTPQVFRADWLRDAHARAHREEHVGTDETELVSGLGHEVHVVEGNERNIKLTHATDLQVAEAWLSEDAGDADASVLHAQGTR
jgi:2-C-methyl-D-erythritol 4-phosphate cytidylyltransferase